MSLLRRPLRLRPLVVSLLPLLATSPLAHAADGPAPTELEAVRITGSRIPRASVEGPSPVTVITQQQIEAQGYRSAFEALSALPLTVPITAVHGSTYAAAWPAILSITPSAIWSTTSATSH